MSDPKLKEAAEEIKGVLKKHDIAAMVWLASAEHMEYLTVIDPSWSALSLEEIMDDVLIRFRCRRKDYPSAEAHAEALRVTIGLLAGFLDMAKRREEDMANMLAMLARDVEFSHITKEES